MTRAAFVVVAVLVSLRATAATPFAEGMVSITFDDNLVSQYTLARPELNKRGYKATFYIISGRLQWGDPNLLDVAQTKQLAADGHEIGSHTVDHVRLTQSSDADLLRQLGESQSQLVSLIGVPDVPNFAYPFGDYDQRVMDAGKRFYVSMRTVDDDRLEFKDGDPHSLKGFSANIPTTLADVKRWIDMAIQQKGWLTLFFHNLTTNPTRSTDFSFADFVAVLDYLQSTNVKVVTIGQGVAQMDGRRAPVLTALAPDSGPSRGGTAVTLTGHGFDPDARVTFDGIPATVNSVSATSIGVITPAHAAGAVDVSVTNPDGQWSTLAKAFTYLAPAGAPSVSSLSPISGSTAGGTAVNIRGSGFVSGATVTFGGTAGTVTRVKATSIRVSTPAHAAGAVDVTVRNPDGQSATLPSAYTFTQTAPSLSTVTPNTGPTAGGTAVTLGGTSFVPGATVSFGVAAATVTSVTPTAVNVTTPAHAAGAVSVRVTNPDGQSSTLASAFTYMALAGAPSISSVSPSSGSSAGGTAVTISGSGFVSGATVTFGGSAAIVTSVAATSIAVRTPAHAAGAVDVRVMNPDGQSATATSAFTYVASTETFTAIPLSTSNWSLVGVTLGPQTTFSGRVAHRLAETTATGHHYIANGNSSRGTGAWELTAVAHADVANRVYLEINPGGSPWPQARFDLAAGTVYSTSGGGAIVSARIDDLGGGWYRCRLLVSSPIRAYNALVSLLSSSWSTSYAGSTANAIYVAEVTLDPR